MCRPFKIDFLSVVCQLKNFKISKNFWNFKKIHKLKITVFLFIIIFCQFQIPKHKSNFHYSFFSKRICQYIKHIELTLFMVNKNNFYLCNKLFLYSKRTWRIKHCKRFEDCFSVKQISSLLWIIINNK